MAAIGFLVRVELAASSVRRAVERERGARGSGGRRTRLAMPDIACHHMPAASGLQLHGVRSCASDPVLDLRYGWDSP